MSFAQLPDPHAETLARKLAAETLCDVRTARRYLLGFRIKGTAVRMRLDAAHALLVPHEQHLSATGT